MQLRAMQAEVSKSAERDPPALGRVYTIVVLVLLLATLPLLLRGVVGALNSSSNDPRQWLPRGFPETETYEWFQRHFGHDEITVVSWPGCTLDDPRPEQLAEALLKHPDPSYFQRAVTGRQMLERLMSRPLELSREEAIRRLQGVLIGPDGETTCVLLTISDRGVGNRVAAVNRIRRAAREIPGLDVENLHMGGPTVDAATIDVESQRLLLELASLSGIVALAITWVRLRSIRLATIILAASVYSTAAALSILYYSGGNMNLVMTMLPPLVFVLSVSAAIHLINYYRDAVGEVRPGSAPVQALRDGWWPCLLASGTTAIGLLSLAVSQIMPVKMFGVYAALGMGASLATVLVMLPIALTVWPESRPLRGSTMQDSASPWQLDRVVDWIWQRNKMIVVISLALMLFSGIGLFMLRSTVRLQYRFGSESRIIRDYRWLEKHLGALVPLELVIHFDRGTERDILKQLNCLRELQREVRTLPEVGAALSGADFAPSLPEGKSVRRITQQVIIRRQASEIKQQLREGGFFSEGENQDRLWRISVRASALSDLDYGRFMGTLREALRPLVEPLDDVHVTYTGAIPLIYKAQRELLNDLVESFLLAFAVIAVVMVVVLRDVRSGLLAMIPNVFPAVVAFGSMGWCGIWIEIGSIMTASAAMGIAVDDTFHLLTWYRRGLSRRYPRREAVHFALRRCASAMAHTTLVCSCALLVFSFSSFMPIRRFAWLMAALLVAALLGDLILLPALLSSPLGKVVRAQGRKH
ncbi:MAG: efflux RND transporter permease subunit [Planctomycetota bacterium]